MTPQASRVHFLMSLSQQDKTIQQDVMKKAISCKASEQVGFKMLTSRKKKLDFRQWVYHKKKLVRLLCLIKYYRKVFQIL
jgi:hypothetical protein